jgi:hypothetical protein
VAKGVRLAYWNTDGFRGRKMELEHFLSHHGVDICLLTKKNHLRERGTSTDIPVQQVCRRNGVHTMSLMQFEVVLGMV